MDAMAAANGKSEEAPDAAEWREERAPKIAQLLACSDLHDVVLMAGRPPQPIPASRVLLAAASPQLSRQLKLQAVKPGAELKLPSADPAVLRAIVAYSCGLQPPFPNCSPAQEGEAAAALAAGLPQTALPGARRPKQASPDREPSDTQQPLLWVVSLLLPAVAAAAAYYPAVSFNLERGGFFMDDAMIRRNQVVVDETFDVARWLRTDYWGLEMFDPNAWTHKSFRPLTVLTFRWNYLLHGFSSAGFHLTNVALHAVVSVQLAGFAATVLRLPCSWSSLLAVLFAVHPVHTENICYIVGRADLLCAIALLLAAQLYAPLIAGQRCWTWLRWVATVVLIVAAGLCKETGFTFFGLFVAWEVIVITRMRAGSAWARWARVIFLLIVGSACCAARFWYTSGTKIARMDPYSNPVAASEDGYVRKLSYALVHGMYMKLCVWPLFLCYDYSMDAVPLVTSLQDVRLLLPCATYVALAQVVVVAVVALRTHLLKRRLLGEGVALGLGIFLLSFLPMANILFPVGTLVGERLLYIPSAGVLMLCVSVGHQASRTKSLATAVVLVLTGGFWAKLCYERVLDWSSVENITFVDGLKQLGSQRTQYNLANLLLVANRHDEALVAYKRSIAADPLERDSQPLYHAGQIMLQRGQYAEAEQYMHKAVSGYFSPLTMAEEEVWHDYGLALWFAEKGPEAIQNFKNAIITNPAFPKAYNNLACAMVLTGVFGQPQNPQMVQEGLSAMEQALGLMQNNPLYWRNAAVLLSLAGDQQAAMGAWQRYRPLDPAAAAAAEASGGLPQDCTWEFYFR
eukprot:TRINITY_DN63842_c0_g1_i1.p1 TRINITY_DN63842_c0_g1~~TRINITY_DN63842_c0_g1_i1.p1  ORF type:complete len:798 (+),score=167.56 TRINITY_DN63842_c0_g1_i1:63-2456(+)